MTRRAPADAHSFEVGDVEPLPWKVWRAEDESCCPCPYCTAIRKGELERAPRQGSSWLEKMGGMSAR